MSERNGSVLVVEDDPEINSLVGAYVQIAGYEYRPALNGTEALEEAGKRAPKAVILDLMLPDVDGFEVCRRLRKTEGGGRRTPIIILSALGGDESRKRGIECGADEYMTKPFDPDVLMRTLKARAGSSET